MGKKSKSQTNRSQHVIPRLHLQHFAGADPIGQVWTHDSIKAKWWSAIPLETGVQTHFYSVERDDGTKDLRLEEFLMKAEDRAAPVYRDLLVGKLPAHSQSKLDFAHFLALMYTRTTAMRRMAGEIRGREAQIRNYMLASNPKDFERSLDRYEKDAGESIGPQMKEKIRRAMLDPSDFRIEVSKESTLVALGASDGLVPILHKMKWTLVFAEQGYFITSDNPVVMAVDPKNTHSIYGNRGFLDKTSEITFPLSPKIMLLLSWQGGASDVASIERRYVEMANIKQAVHSERFLFAHIKDKRIGRLALAHRDKRPSMTIEGFGPKNFAPIGVSR